MSSELERTLNAFLKLCGCFLFGERMRENERLVLICGGGR